MSYRTILVCLNEVDRAAVLLQVAGELAQRHQAHVIGLFVIPSVRIYPTAGMAMAPVVFDAHQDAFQQRSDTARAVFEAAMGKEWRCVESHSPQIADTVIEHAMHCDLVIASQTSDESTADVDVNFAERTVMESGRPVLLVPYYGRFEQCGQRVLIGWNGTREAARAAFDAVPLIKNAMSVHVTWVDSQDSSEQAGPLPGAELAKTLSRHGVKATAEALPTDRQDIGEALLSHASDLSADLIVMGAYGHSRLRQFILGGATRTILKSMTVPVLMSH